MSEEPLPQQIIGVLGIVSDRDMKPYVQITDEMGKLYQLSVTEARQIAMDILVSASRAEADAMILTFFKIHELPLEAATQLMIDFRNFRANLDEETVDHDHRGPVE